MFTLRIIEETREKETDPFDQVIENFYLGSSYSILKKGITKEFSEVMKERYPEKDTSTIRAILCAHFNDTVSEFFIEDQTPLLHYEYYIMTDSGKTFERL